MKTIVFYVKHVSMLRAWVDPVAPFLIEAGYHIVILHTSRLNEDTSQARTAPATGYETIELGDKSMRRIIALIDELKPSAIVMFTFRSLFDLLLLRVARHCAVPTIYIQHGFYVSVRLQMANKRASISRYWRFLRWYLSFLSAARRKSLGAELSIVYRAMIRIDYRSTRFDYAIFYSPEGLKDANRFFDFKNHQVSFSGYPVAQSRADLDAIFAGTGNGTHKKVLYVHQPFVLDRFTHIDHEGEFAYLKRIGEACARQGYQLVAKIHPRESVDRYTQSLASTDVTIETDSSMVEVLKECSIVIGHFSTALFTGVLLRKPVIVMDYPGLDDAYYDFFADVGVRVHNTDELGLVLASDERRTQRLPHFDDFIRAYIGEHNTYEHQAQTIADVVESAGVSAGTA